MKIGIRLVLVFVLSIIFSACGKQEIENAHDWPLQDFAFTDQQDKPFGLTDLKGKVWVADFIFTKCEDVCLPMTSNMAKLQTMVESEGVKDVEFVSFSVDPTVDQPDVLAEYAEQFNVNFSNWHFLTGYTQAEIEQFALENFKTIVQKPVSEDQVIHGTSFYLVDKKGTIVKDYTGLAEIPLKEIIKDIKILQQAE
jgi:protein SCO1